MRKGLLLFMGLVVLMVGLSSSLYAGGIINKQNLSADYIRTLNRNAATDMADAAAFNPAGTAMMQDGLYVKADAIYFGKITRTRLPSTPAIFNLGTLESEEPSIIPGFFAVYKQDRWSGFFGVTVPGGGGEVRYQDGNARTVILSLLAPSEAWALTWAVPPATPPTSTNILKPAPIMSATAWAPLTRSLIRCRLSGGVRYVDAYQKFKGRATGTTGPPDTVNVKIERTDEA